MANQATAKALQNAVTAIDIVLEPDATMIQQARAANAALLKNYPKGYALDNDHKQHISVMGGYFYTANLEKVYAAVDKVLADQKLTSWKLTAIKYYYIPLKGIGLGSIVVQPTDEMIRLQKEFIVALTGYMAPASAGSAAAFDTTAQDPTINQATLNAVATYFLAHTGEHYNPHVTIGVGTVDYLNTLVAAPFPTFTFSPLGMSVYQFGNYGTAKKQLHSFKLAQ